MVARYDRTRPEPVRLGGIAEQTAAQIEQRTGIETRTTVLGHVQRSGTPIPPDRVLATQLGHHAVRLLMSGATGRMVAIQDGRLGDVDLRETADRQRVVPLDDPLLAAARAVKTCFGD